MTLHPRLGGSGGQLALPRVVLVVSVADRVSQRGDVLAADFGHPYDPFDRLDDRGMDRRRRPTDGTGQRAGGLLLAEEFARIDVSRPRRLRSWLLARGAVNRLDFYGSARDVTEAPFEAIADWDAQDSAAGIKHEQDYVRRELDWLVELSRCRPGGPLEWNAANGPSWDAAMGAIQSRLTWRAELAVRSTARLVAVEDDKGEEAAYELRGLRQAVSWRERREWRSILAPISLQLFESWRRISEGLPGAALCRECDQPFLILDGRRIAFCTDRERNRHNQRARRRSPA